jgi:hypothetical protein
VTAVVGQNRKQEHGNVEDELEHVGEEQSLKRGAVGQPLIAARRRHAGVAAAAMRKQIHVMSVLLTARIMETAVALHWMATHRTSAAA